MAHRESLHAIVQGYVQGVFFRAFVTEKARELGLTGFVRNLVSGHEVEVLAEGDKAKLLQLVDLLKIGPPAARVEKVDVSWSKASGKYTDFAIEY